ncbi:MAG: 2Fe-2S iron-sulfur cluster-binding protein [Alteromonas oceani]
MLMTVIPSGRILAVEPGETLLQTLLKNDEPISYSCQDGRCGLCRCSISLLERGSGELPVSLNDESAQSVLACQTRTKTDCLVSIPSVEDLCIVEAQIIGAEVFAVRSLSSTVDEFVLRTKTPAQFRAGQHFDVTWHPTIIRPLSAASMPGENELRFHVQRHPFGRFSQFAANNKLVGNTVTVKGPLGSVYLREHCTRPILCISHNTGLGAMVTLLRSIADAGLLNTVYIYAGFSLREDMYGIEELKDVISGLRGVTKLRVVVASGLKERKRGYLTGLLTDAIHLELARLKECRVYSFGSPHAIETVSWSLKQAGVLPDRLHSQSFLYSHY